MKEVYLISAKRTAIGGLLGNLSSLTAPQLGAQVLSSVYEDAGIAPELIDSVYLGNVLSANLGQLPARQAAIYAGIPYETEATTINKVCASGMKALMIGAQQIQLGLEHVVAVGGMESMSNVPHYANLRKPSKLGHATLTDGMLKDGLWDAYHDFHMGNAAEIGVRHFGFTRAMLDEYAIRSYALAAQATKEGKFKAEIAPIELAQKGGSIWIDSDEDIDKIIVDKVSKLSPTFEKEGLLTAANSSNLNDGAAAMILASAEAVARYGLTPMAKVLGYADAAQAPEWFTTAPARAIPKALQHAGLSLSEISFFEINEAYASVILSMRALLELDLNQVNVYGGAVAMGHPIGASGARIVTTLSSVLRQEGGKYGVAAICNGGGGASAIVLENLQF